MKNIPKEILESVPWQYAFDVRSGKLITGKYVRLAVERFFNWVEHGAVAWEDADGVLQSVRPFDCAQGDKKGDGETPLKSPQGDNGEYVLKHHYGMDPIYFFEDYLIHTKGEMAGQPFMLSPFQQFTIYNVFGWVSATTDLRRVNEVYETMAKKNGKTAVMAGLGLYHLCADDESEAEVYVGATKEEQAKLCFNQAVSFIKRNGMLSANGFTSRQNRVLFTPLGGMMRPLGGDSKTQDGINSSFSIIDEYHAHKDDSVKENLESSMVSRSQPLLWQITTKGFFVYGVCKQYENVCKDILDGKIPEDEGRFMMIHEMDKDDDWEDERNWEKANPNLGVSVTIEKIRNQFDKAQLQKSKQAQFKTKNLNIWVDAPDVWIENEIWQKNKVDEIPESVFIENGCYAGVDLATTTDICAYVLLSEPDADGNRYIKPYFYCPKENIEKRSKSDKVPYMDWVDKGYLIATEGNTTDYAVIENTIYDTYFKYKCERVEFDKFEANNIITRLQKRDVECSLFSQSIGVISWPTKQFEKLVYEGKLKHDGNPILAWMLSGCVIYRDANDNMKVHKGDSHKSSKKRVDGIVATIMALGGSLSDVDDKPESSYNDADADISFGIE